jgi:hypothetical protein
MRQQNKIKHKPFYKQFRFYGSIFMAASFAEMTMKVINVVSGYYNVWFNFVFAWAFCFIYFYKLYGYFNRVAMEDTSNFKPTEL